MHAHTHIRTQPECHVQHIAVVLVVVRLSVLWHKLEPVRGMEI